jgi:hypothetical protein
MIARRRLRRIRQHEHAFQPWNFDPNYNLEMNLYGYARCPLARCRGHRRYSTQGRPWTVWCSDCGFREPLRTRLPVVFRQGGFSIVGGW